MTTTLHYTSELVTTTCWCGIPHAVPSSLYDIAKRDHSHTIYCPLGHKWVFSGKTEAEKLEERLKNERDRSARLAAERDQAEASLRATKGVVTKMKKRAAGGACPCCNRTFTNLQRHMSTKHPDFAIEATS